MKQITTTPNQKQALKDSLLWQDLKEEEQEQLGGGKSSTDEEEVSMGDGGASTLGLLGNV